MSSGNRTGNPIVMQAIGMIHSPFDEAAGTPIQPIYGRGVEGTVMLDEAFVSALDDIEGFDRIWLIPREVLLVVGRRSGVPVITGQAMAHGEQVLDRDALLALI